MDLIWSQLGSKIDKQQIKEARKTHIKDARAKTLGQKHSLQQRTWIVGGRNTIQNLLDV